MSAPNALPDPEPGTDHVEQVHVLATRLGRTPTVREVKAELRVGTERARVLVAELGNAGTPPAARSPRLRAVPESGTAPEEREVQAGEPVPAVPGPVPDPGTAVPGSQGRALAWVALLVALGASVAANVAYARPEAGPRLTASVAPVLVVLAAGLLERVPLVGARWWQKWLAIGGLMFVVLAAFITSYQHQRALLLTYGNPVLSATLLPFAVDALIVMSSVCLAVIADRRRAGGAA